MFRVDVLKTNKIEGNRRHPLNIAFHAGPDIRIRDTLNRNINVGYLSEPLRSQNASPLDNALRREVFGYMPDNVISFVACTFPALPARRRLLINTLLIGPASTLNIHSHGDLQYSKANAQMPHSA